MSTLKLDDIVKQIISIAADIENSVMFSKSLDAQKKRTAANLILSSVQPILPNATKESALSKNKIKSVLRSLEEISKTYQIKELKKPIKELKAYLDSLG